MATTEPVTLRRISENAFRTLGLSALASQSAIDMAARRMRVWPDPTRIPPTPWDLLKLGPLARSRTDIERAVSRLQQPTSRLAERLLWFHGDHPPLSTSNLTAQAPLVDIGKRHEEMVAALVEALTTEPSASSVANWCYLLDQVEDMAMSPDASAWLGRLEEAGNFEKRSTKQEIDAALESLPKAFAAGLEEQAFGALVNSNWDLGRRLGRLLHERSVSDVRRNSLERLLNRVEDLLSVRCAELDRELRDLLRTNATNPLPFIDANLKASQRGQQVYSRTLRPLLEAAEALSNGDDLRQLRLRTKCGTVLILLALGWEWSHQMVTAEQTLLEARDLLTGTQGVTDVSEPLKRVSPLAEKERSTAIQAKQQQAVRSLLSTYAKPPPNQTATKRITRKNGGRGITRIRWAVGIATLLIILGVELLPHKPVAPQMPTLPPTAQDLGQPPAVSDSFEGLFTKIQAAKPTPSTEPSTFGDASRE